MINYIKDNNLEDFDISVIFSDGFTNHCPNIRSIDLVGLGDIGVSSNVAYFDGELDE